MSVMISDNLRWLLTGNKTKDYRKFVTEKVVVVAYWKWSLIRSGSYREPLTVQDQGAYNVKGGWFLACEQALSGCRWLQVMIMTLPRQKTKKRGLGIITSRFP